MRGPADLRELHDIVEDLFGVGCLARPPAGAEETERSELFVARPAMVMPFIEALRPRLEGRGPAFWTWKSAREAVAVRRGLPPRGRGAGAGERQQQRGHRGDRPRIDQRAPSQTAANCRSTLAHAPFSAAASGLPASLAISLLEARKAVFASRVTMTNPGS